MYICDVSLLWEIVASHICDAVSTEKDIPETQIRGLWNDTVKLDPRELLELVRDHVVKDISVLMSEYQKSIVR